MGVTVTSTSTAAAGRLPVRRIARGLRRAAAPLAGIGSVDLFARDLGAPLPAAAPPEGWRVREASPAELDEVRRGSDPERPPGTLRERFRRGDLCFVVVDEAGRAVHSRWATADAAWIPELRRHLILAPGDAYFYDGYTRPEARRRGVDAAMRCALFRALAERGHRRAVSYVRADNPAGLRAARRWQEPLGRVRCLRLGGASALLGAGRIPGLWFAPEPAFEGEGGRSARARRWLEWFESWLERPLEQRSSGFCTLPEEYFEAAGRFVAGALELDPGSDDVLDVGCDSAMLSRRVAPHCRRLTGVDLVPGLLWSAPVLTVRTGSGARPAFLACDGRRLPFRSGAFDKVYCVSTIHTLPSREDGARVVAELARVCAPGGRVLVGSVPDRARRWRARREQWRRGGWRGRIELLASLLLPAPVKTLLHRLAGVAPERRLVALEYDLDRLRERVAERGHDCRRIDFPSDYWSRDFRATRSNLLISVPAAEETPRRPVRALA